VQKALCSDCLTKKHKIFLGWSLGVNGIDPYLFLSILVKYSRFQKEKIFIRLCLLHTSGSRFYFFSHTNVQMILRTCKHKT
jgi:hypothetical protein